MVIGRIELLTHIEHLGAWNYVLLALLVILEGPIATLAGAAIAATGTLKPGLVFVTAALSNLLADALWYLVGYFGGSRWLLRSAHKLGARQDVAQLVQDMNDHAWKILFMAKLTLSFSIPALIAAGIVRLPWRRAFKGLLPAEGLWTGSLVLAGYWFGQSLTRLEQGVQIVAILWGAVFVALLVWYFRRRYRLQDLLRPAHQSEPRSYPDDHQPE